MKIAILSQKESLYSTSRLVDAARSRGHEVTVINYLQCTLDLNFKSPSIFYKGEKLNEFDAVIPRIAASKTIYGCAVVRQFEAMHIFSLNSSLAIAQSRDKLYALQLLAKERIGLPATAFGYSQAESLFTVVSGTPIVLKVLESTQGAGVMLVDSKNCAKSVIQAFQGLKAPILAQEFIAEAKGQDIRCFVVGNKVIGAMCRQSTTEEFRSNLHLGGSASAIKITSAEREIAVRAAKTLKLEVAGVDLLRSNSGPVVMEVNSSPGLEGIEEVTGKDIADAIIRFIEKKLSYFEKMTKIASEVETRILTTV